MFDWIRVSGDIVELKEANAKLILRVGKLEKAIKLLRRGMREEADIMLEEEK